MNGEHDSIETAHITKRVVGGTLTVISGLKPCFNVHARFSSAGAAC